MVNSTLIYLVFTDDSIGIWDFLTLSDALTLSTTNNFFAGLIITDNAMTKLMGTKPNLMMNIGRLHIHFPIDLSLGMFRRTLNRIFAPQIIDAVITVNPKSGRIVLDVGSALNDKDAFVMPLQEEDEGEEVPEEHKIHTHIEKVSCDEWDDFVPRHPMAKMSHRRGDSYFNSDVDMYANEAVFDMKDIAAAALDTEDTEEDANAIKNKFLARKKSTMTFNKYPGITRSFNERTQAAVTSVESDEER